MYIWTKHAFGRAFRGAWFKRAPFSVGPRRSLQETRRSTKKSCMPLAWYDVRVWDSALPHFDRDGVVHRYVYDSLIEIRADVRWRMRSLHGQHVKTAGYAPATTLTSAIPARKVNLPSLEAITQGIYESTSRPNIHGWRRERTTRMSWSHSHAWTCRWTDTVPSSFRGCLPAPQYLSTRLRGLCCYPYNKDYQCWFRIELTQ